MSDDSDLAGGDEGGIEIRLPSCRPGGVVGGQCGAHAVPARVGDQRVHTTEAVRDLAQHGAHALRIGGVRHPGDGARASRHPFDRFASTPDDDDLRTLACESSRARLANPAATAGDEDHLPLHSPPAPSRRRCAPTGKLVTVPKSKPW